jgi:hypothetical protein
VWFRLSEVQPTKTTERKRRRQWFPPGAGANRGARRGKAWSTNTRRVFKRLECEKRDDGEARASEK